MGRLKKINVDNPAFGSMNVIMHENTLEEGGPISCDHITRFDSGYGWGGDENQEYERPELLTEAGESVSYDVEFTYCPRCGVKLEKQ